MNRCALLRRGAVLALAAALMVAGLSCHTMLRYRAVKFIPISPSLMGDGTTVTKVREYRTENLRIVRDGITVQTQLPHAYTRIDRNPGVYLTLLVRNDTESPLLVPSDRMVFSRFPPHQRPKAGGTRIDTISVEPAKATDIGWVIAPDIIAKVHLTFRSPARTPGYMDFVLVHTDSNEEYVYCFKIKRD
jgi:hypothetical protein